MGNIIIDLELMGSIMIDLELVGSLIINRFKVNGKCNNRINLMKRNLNVFYCLVEMFSLWIYFELHIYWPLWKMCLLYCKVY